MVAFKNFYETVEECRMRLRNTVVQYKDDFYWVHEVSNHAQDGVFRVYMDRLGRGGIGSCIYSCFPNPHDYSTSSMGSVYDAWMSDVGKPSGFLRKFANSRHFNKFRPFPLGNVNTQNGGVVHCVRSPTRNMYQGLMRDAVVGTVVRSCPEREKPIDSKIRQSTAGSGFGDTAVNIFSPEFYYMLRGLYPSYEEVITNLRDPSICNDGCAFNRDWSVFRGPADLLFLCFQDSGVGVIYENGEIRLGKDHEHLRESIEEMDLSPKITVKGVS